MRNYLIENFDPETEFSEYSVKDYENKGNLRDFFVDNMDLYHNYICGTVNNEINHYKLYYDNADDIYYNDVSNNISLSSEINIDNARLLYNNGNCSDEIKNTVLAFFTEDELNT